MKKLRILGIVLIIAGFGSLFFSNYIMNEVNTGKIKIEKGQKAVDQGNKLFSLNPYAQQIGKGFTNSAQQKINEGQAQVNYYENLANRLKTAGIIGIIAGAGAILASFFVKRK
jgi:hypothetical protein